MEYQLTQIYNKNRENIPQISKFYLLGKITNKEVKYPLKFGTNLIGRTNDCNIQVVLPELSRHHAIIEVTEDDEIFIQDLGSVNCTYRRKMKLRSHVMYELFDNIEINIANVVQFIIVKETDHNNSLFEPCQISNESIETDINKIRKNKYDKVVDFIRYDVEKPKMSSTPILRNKHNSRGKYPRLQSDEISEKENINLNHSCNFNNNNSANLQEKNVLDKIFVNKEVNFKSINHNSNFNCDFINNSDTTTLNNTFHLPKSKEELNDRNLTVNFDDTLILEEFNENEELPNNKRLKSLFNKKSTFEAIHLPDLDNELFVNIDNSNFYNIDKNTKENEVTIVYDTELPSTNKCDDEITRELIDGKNKEVSIVFNTEITSDEDQTNDKSKENEVTIVYDTELCLDEEYDDNIKLIKEKETISENIRNNQENAQCKKSKDISERTTNIEDEININYRINSSISGEKSTDNNINLLRNLEDDICNEKDDEAHLPAVSNDNLINCDVIPSALTEIVTKDVKFAIINKCNNEENHSLIFEGDIDDYVHPSKLHNSRTQVVKDIDDNSLNNSLDEDDLTQKLTNTDLNELSATQVVKRRDTRFIASQVNTNEDFTQKIVPSLKTTGGIRNKKKSSSVKSVVDSSDGSNKLLLDRPVDVDENNDNLEIFSNFVKLRPSQDKTLKYDDSEIPPVEEIVINRRSSQRIAERKSSSNNNNIKKKPLKRSLDNKNNDKKLKKSKINSNDSRITHSSRYREPPNKVIMFTGLGDVEKWKKIVSKLGGKITENPMEASHLVTDKVRRTVKFMACLSRGLPIVLPKWLDICKSINCFTGTSSYFVDRETLQSAISNAQKFQKSSGGILSHFKCVMFLSEFMKPTTAELISIVESAGGMPIQINLGNWHEHLSDTDSTHICLANPSDIKDKGEIGKAISEMIKHRVPIVSVEFLFSLVMTQNWPDVEIFKLLK